MSKSVYILELEQNKWYIGSSINYKSRVDSHFSGNGSEYTKLYKPIKLHKVYSNSDEIDEDNYTLKYMSQYGIDNVRGGTFTQIFLDNHHKKVIQEMIFSRENKCYKCGSKDHKVNECGKENEKKSKKEDICYVCSGTGRSYWSDGIYGACLECCCIDCGSNKCGGRDICPVRLNL